MLFGTLAQMFLKRLLAIVMFWCAVLPFAPAQEQGPRTEMEEALKSRYRLTIVGGSLMGVRGENSIRKTGGVVILMHDGFYGAYNRNRLPANAIQNGKTEVLTGDKEVPLAAGEKFYVTAVDVGSDVVTLGLLSARAIPGGSKTSQLWCTVNFFFDKNTLDQGDIGKVYSVMDQWLIPQENGPAVSPSPASPSPVRSSSATPSTPIARTAPGNAVDLKPGMTREEIVSALGAPLQDAEFADHRWLTYPGITITLEQGKLSSVERNAEALIPVKISSEPGGADIFLDGNFVSSTPAMIRLHAGTYKVAVKMSGYTDWEREVKILPGAEVTLDARLSK
jgi:PEGA domain